MKQCPQCHTEQESDQITACPACGYNFAGQTDPIPTDGLDDDDLEFQVYESKSDDREFVGGQQDFEAGSKPNDLGVQRPEDILEDEAAQPAPLVPDPLDEPIGQSAPFIPTPEPYEPEPPASSADFSDLRADDKPEEPEVDTSPSGIKKLSEEEVRAIESNLYQGSGYLSDTDKRDLMDKLDDREQLFNATPIVPPKKTEKPEVSPLTVKKINEEIDDSLPSPKMANRGKGVAYFYRNFIQLQGSQHLLADDELVVGGRLYELRPKTIDRKFLIGAAGFVFVVLLFALGSMFVSSPSGTGVIAGIVLDENDQPFVQGATINLPDLNEEVKSNGEGMFVTDRIPSGSHRVELVWKGKTWASDYTTVADNEVSIVVLRPTGEQQYGTVTGDNRAHKQPLSSSANTSKKTTSPGDTRVASADPPPKDDPPSAGKKPKSAPARTEPGKLTLQANVQNARLRLDGDVLGAGNLTYSRIKPGTYRYEVTRDGYKPLTGKVTISPGEQQTLAVKLEKLPQQAKTQEYSADDFHFSGLAALQESDFEAAATDLAEAVRREPGNADANFSLGEAYSGLKDWPRANAAYLRAAEQYRIKKDYSRALTAYNQALRADDESIPAYLGRADLYLAEKEERAAVVDYESVIRIDKRNAAAYFGLGRARFEQGLYDKAIKHFKDARSLEPKNPLIHQYLMLSYMADSDFDEVKKAYDKFADIASPEEIKRMRSDSRYTAVLRVVDSKR